MQVSVLLPPVTHTYPSPGMLKNPAAGVIVVRSPFSVKKAESYMRGIEHVTAHFKGHPMEKWAARRVRTAQKMLEKRMRRAGLLAPGPSWRWW